MLAMRQTAEICYFLAANAPPAENRAVHSDLAGHVLQRVFNHKRSRGQGGAAPDAACRSCREAPQGAACDMYHQTIHIIMIVGTKNKLAANAVADRFGKGFPADLVKRTRAMLSALDAAVRLEDLRFPPGNHLEELKGDRAGQHSVRINGQWRICFVWTAQGPADVEIVDDH